MTELIPVGCALLLMWSPISYKQYCQQVIRDAGAVEIGYATHEGAAANVSIVWDSAGDSIAAHSLVCSKGQSESTCRQDSHQ